MRKTISLLMMAALLLPGLTGCSAKAEQRTGEAQGYGGTLKVQVTLSGEDITKVKITEHHETPGVGSRAIDALPAAIEEADSIDVDSVSGATISSTAIKEAVSQELGYSVDGLKVDGLILVEGGDYGNKDTSQFCSNFCTCHDKELLFMIIN